MDASEALNNAKINKDRATSKYFKEYDGFATLTHSPKFQLTTNTKFFTIGSCFARNIEFYMNRKKIPYLSQVPLVDGEYFKMGGSARAGYQNVYTPGAVLEASRLILQDDPYVGITEVGGLNYDLLTHGLKGLEAETAQEIRDGLIETYRNLEKSDVVIITLGFIEAWYHKPSQIWVNQSPADPKLRKVADEFSFEVLDETKTLAILEEAIDNFHKINPNLKFIFTVSPVPLGSTFTEEHILVANQRSKSTLHCVAQHLWRKYDFVDYFPSYEIVSLSERKLAFEEDNIHVKGEVVSKVMDCFFKSYFN